ncbi:hypothetical protein C8R46DRAFT_1273341 [Mycena filopes]|nr:hypothetical protein C8R46DRAFT_1273341 [Mycena filopes]
MLTLDQDRARIADFDAQIFELEHSLLKLRVARDVVQARLDAFRYPVLTLPNEVVGEIFTQFVPTYPLCPPLVGPKSPTLLTHICHLWREIALRTRALWSAIDLSNQVVSNSQQAYICAIWLQRSLSAPLSMRMDSRFGSNPQLFSTVIAHRKRWESLKIDLLPSELTAVEGSMPFLRHLDLAVDEDDDVHVDPGALLDLDVPLLRSVILDDGATRHVTLPWAQITSVALNRVYPEECAPLLAQTCNLVHCRLYLFNPGRQSLLPPISLPRLETLVMTTGGKHPLVEYLHKFIAPALLTLQVPESFLGPHPIDSLRSFISASGCKLRNVVITGDEIKFSFDSYRKAFPSIDKFSFRRYHPYGSDDDYSDFESPE